MATPVQRVGSNDNIVDADGTYAYPTAKTATSFVANAHQERTRTAAEGVKLGMVGGVIIPCCENMWGVLIFLRFYFIVGHAGVYEAWGAVVLSYTVALFTALSVSAVASNSSPKKGGVYALMANALGHSIAGAAGLVYFLALCFLACLEMVGAIEALVTIYPALDFAGHIQMIGSALCISLAFLVLVGVKFVSRLGVFFALIVAYSLWSMYAGLFAAPVNGRGEPAITGLDGGTLSDNMGPDYSDGESFQTVLGIFYPCFTGILAGANRAENLQDHQRAIPVGTLTAINLSLVLYLSLMLMWGSVASRDYLKGDYCPSRRMGRELLAGGGGCEVLGDIGWPDATVLQWGVVIASISQAMQCMINAPRIFQAVAADGIIPIISWFGTVSDDDEPKRAMLPVYIVCGCGVLAGAIEVIAPIVSMCFLTCYATINLSCFVMSLTQAPSWRPSWKYFHPGTALVGTLLAVVCMFLISSWWALVTIAIAVGLLVYIQYKGVANGYGSGLTGLIAQWALFILGSIQKQSLEAEVNWRPQILCLYKFHSDTDETHGFHHDDILYLAHQLRKARGLCIVTTVETGRLTKEKHMIADREKSVLEAHMEKIGLKGFVHCVVSSSFHQGFSHAMQISGLGPLSPNTIIMAWPRHSHETLWRKFPRKADEFCQLLREATAMDKSVIIMKGKSHFPEPTDVQTGFIDVWWIIHDGGLLLLIAHLLQKHRVWRECHLRLHMVASVDDDADELVDQLQQWLVVIRMDADIDVIKADPCVIEPYAANYTLRREEREHLLHDLQTRIGHRVEPCLQTLQRPSQSANDTNSVFDPKFFELPSPAIQPHQNAEGASSSRTCIDHPSRTNSPDDDDQAGTAPENEHKSDSAVGVGTGFGVVEQNGGPHGELGSAGEDAPPPEEAGLSVHTAVSPRSRAIRVADPEGGYEEWQRGQDMVAAIQNGKAVVSPQGEVLITNRMSNPGRFLVRDIEQDDQALDHDISPPSSGSTSPMLSPLHAPGAHSSQRSPIAERGEFVADEQPAHVPIASPRRSPRHTPAPVPLPEAGRKPSFRTREERYNQFHTLNQKIRYNMDSYLKAPKLVIVNLPDPLAETDPVEYMQYVQILTEGIPRMLLIHGTGHEIISDFNVAVDPDDVQSEEENEHCAAAGAEAEEFQVEVDEEEEKRK